MAGITLRLTETVRPTAFGSDRCSREADRVRQLPDLGEPQSQKNKAIFR